MFQMSSDAPGGGPVSNAQNHKLKYKNAALDTQELRRRREEEGIQLRKQKREQQLFKKRNVSTTETLQVTTRSLLVAMRIPDPTQLSPFFFGGTDDHSGSF